MIFITINTVAEFICFLAALIFLSNEKIAAWKLFIAYTLLTCIVEFSGIYMNRVAHIFNHHLYNVFLLFECGMVSYTLYNLYKPYKDTRKWLLAWYSIFMIVFITELFATHFKGFVSITATVMSVMFVFACLYYYYLKLMDEQFEQLAFSAPFWWVSGSLFFYFGSTTCNVFFDYMSHSSTVIYGHSIRYYIFNLLNIILYAFWSYAFLCRYLRRKSSS